MIRAKLVFRNVISKPLRSAIIIISLAAAAFAALFCISGITSAQNTLKDFFRAKFGDSDIMISESGYGLDINEKEFPAGSRTFGMVTGSVNMTLPNTEYFNYVKKISIHVLGMDTGEAYDMHMLTSALPTDGGVTITFPLASQLGLKEGDDITIGGSNDKKYTMKILSDVRPERLLESSSLAIKTTKKLANDICGNSPDDISVLYADVDDGQIAKVIADISDKHPGIFIFSTESQDSNETYDSMLNIYYLIFAVVFLMVCFIIVSMSKHIVNERMSVIGMLRSIGLALSLMGTASNLIMNFEQSRRKYAVYYSSSMSKASLKRLILLETLLTNGLSITAAAIFGMYFLQIISRALTALSMSVPLVSPLMYALIFGAAAFLILSVTVIKPIAMLSSMNIAEEIKTSAD